MENSLNKRNISRKRRTMRVRKALRGSAAKPRLTVFKSLKHLYVQLIDDEAGVTLAGIGTMTKSVQEKDLTRKSKEAARYLGSQIASMAKKKNIEKVVFDRGMNKYHGLIAELADEARKSGLQF